MGVSDILLLYVLNQYLTTTNQLVIGTQVKGFLTQFLLLDLHLHLSTRLAAINKHGEMLFRAFNFN